MLGFGRFTKTVSDATIGTAIVLAHVVLAERLDLQRRQRTYPDLAASPRLQRQADSQR